MRPEWSLNRNAESDKIDYERDTTGLMTSVGGRLILVLQDGHVDLWVAPLIWWLWADYESIFIAALIVTRLVGI